MLCIALCQEQDRGQTFSFALSLEHRHNCVQPQSHNSVHSYKHTQINVLSVTILRLSDGSGLTVAEDKQFHHSRRQHRTLQDINANYRAGWACVNVCTYDWECDCGYCLTMWHNGKPISISWWLVIKILKSLRSWASTSNFKVEIFESPHISLCVCVCVWEGGGSVPG